MYAYVYVFLRRSIANRSAELIYLYTHTHIPHNPDYIVVGHCCESGDLFSCVPGDGDSLKARKLPLMEIGDLISIEGAGAYCSSMSTKVCLCHAYVYVHTCKHVNAIA